MRNCRVGAALVALCASALCAPGMVAPTPASAAVTASERGPLRGPVPCGGVLFRASLDGPDGAEIAVGGGAMGYSDGADSRPDHRFRFVPGRIGRALEIAGGESQRPERYGDRAVFPARGNLSLRAGTLSFWVRPTSDLWTVAVRSDSNDRSTAPAILTVTGRSDQLQLVVHLRDDRNARVGRKAPRLLAPGWHHVALLWEEASRFAVAVDGELALSTGDRDDLQLGWTSAAAIELRGAAFDELAVLDRVVGPDELRRLVAGRPPDTAAACHAAPLRRSHRVAQLGWTPGAAAIPVGDETRIEVVGLESAKAVRRSGWRAADGRQDSVWPLRYQGYIYRQGGGLHLRSDPGSRIDWVRVVGGYGPGVLAAGDALGGPGSAPVLARLAGGPFVTSFRLATPYEGRALSLYRTAAPGVKPDASKVVREIELLRVAPGGAARDPERTRLFLGAATAASVAGIHRAQLVAWYPAGERDVRLFDRERAGTTRAPIEALRYTHLALPAAPADRGLGGVRLHLEVAGWSPGNRVQLRVHDPANPWRALSEVDVETRRPGGLDALLEFPPTLWPAGTELLVSLASEQPGTLGSGSFLALHAPAMADARAGYLRQQQRLLKDRFSALSEPRPWAENGADDRWLRNGLPAYDEIARLIDDLAARFPDDAWTREYQVWTHSRDADLWQSLPTPTPADADVAGAPAWAALQKSLLGLELDQVHWWIDNRRAPDGEFGSRIDDDTDLVGDWPSLALIHDPDGALHGSLRSLADLAWKTLMRNGLNKQMTDVLHAYEVGINIQPFAALLDYGNPVLIERMMTTARRYDGFLLTPPEDGIRRMRGDWFDDREVKVGSNWRKPQHRLRMLHPGLMLMWYDGHPGLTRMMQEYFKGASGPWPYAPGLPHALYFATGDPSYSRVQRHPEVDPVWCRILRFPSIQPALLEPLRRVRFPTPRTGALGNEDFATLSSYVLWNYTRDDADLVPGLTHDWKEAWYSRHMRTVTEQSGDRVAVNKNLTDAMYLGGFPGARGFTYPVFAVSYEGFHRDFAALVLDSSPARLRWTGYVFGPPIENGRLVVWGLDPGRYDVAIGPDRDGDGRIDRPDRRLSLDLRRGEAIPVTLPSRVRMVVDVEQTRADTPLWQRTDLAVTGEDAVITGTRVRVLVHNVGIEPSGPFDVDLVGAGGKVLASRAHPGLDGIGDLQPKIAEISFEGVPVKGPLEVRVRGSKPEITSRNDRARLR